jgi:hypothetical protein
VIVEFLIQIWENLVTWLLTWFPEFDFPAVEFGIGAVLAPVAAGASQLGAWIPWDTVELIVPISVGMYVTGLVIRAVKSFIPSISG